MNTRTRIVRIGPTGAEILLDRPTITTGRLTGELMGVITPTVHATPPENDTLDDAKEANP